MKRGREYKNPRLPDPLCSPAKTRSQTKMSADEEEFLGAIGVQLMILTRTTLNLRRMGVLGKRPFCLMILTIQNESLMTLRRVGVLGKDLSF